MRISANVPIPAEVVMGRQKVKERRVRVLFHGHFKVKKVKRVAYPAGCKPAPWHLAVLKRLSRVFVRRVARSPLPLHALRRASQCSECDRQDGRWRGRAPGAALPSACGFPAVSIICRNGHCSIDRPFIVLTETKPSKRHIPVWAQYSPQEMLSSGSHCPMLTVPRVLVRRTASSGKGAPC